MTAAPTDTAAKADRLVAVLGTFTDGVAVAFSGGIDSTVVAKAARLALGDRAVAVTADSPSVARAELADARRLAALIGIRHEIIQTNEFAAVPPERRRALLLMQGRTVRHDRRPIGESGRRRHL